MLKVHRWFIILGIVFLVFIALSTDFRSANFDKSFKEWVKEMASIARSEGISERTVLEFENSVTPLMFLIEKDERDLSSRVNSLLTDDLTLKSQIFFRDNLDLLYQKESEYLVSPEVVVAAMGIGSYLGEDFGNNKMIDILSTLGANDQTSDFYRNELISLLRLIDKKVLDFDVTGNNDGTFTYLGINPSVYLYYGVDANNDGRIDLFLSKNDYIETYFYVMNQQLWRYAENWGLVVSLPVGIDLSVLEGSQNAKNLNTWASLGFKNQDGTPISDEYTGLATLFVTSPYTGVLLFNNFNTIYSTNNSLVRSIAIGILTDKITGYVKSMEYKNTYVKPSTTIVNTDAYEHEHKLKRDDLPPPEKYKYLEFAK